MNDEERNNFKESVRKTTELFKRRNTPEDWARNLIDGSSSLKTGNSWKHFYAWLSNPAKYNEEEVNNMGTLATEKTVIEPYDDCMRVDTFENGNEILVHVKNMSLEEDEKAME